MPFNTLNLLVVITILIIPIIPTLWAIVDLPKRRFSSPRSKVFWFAMVATLPCLGAVLYILVARRGTQPRKPDVNAGAGGWERARRIGERKKLR